ncbi:olfactory receptor 1P1-like [Epinephelus fuscoguttatus]|uniref:olfactory receptor 1P1-like n=1 Tax=Epinephelus fuscoguttatus TaxID=293821 RepID=UPI0020D0D2BD|nr:olfactory receptor 1P1-like [Epinephelus fuscoguttatus]
MDNASVVTFFRLSGLNYRMQHRIILFVLTLLCYSVIWIVDIVVIMTITVDRKLHEPMYIFLCNLCISGLYGTAGFYPKFLMDLLSTTHVISYAGCLLQSFVLHSSSGSDLSILAVMAYDRYVAICHPLMYHSVMTTQRISLLVAFSWLLPLLCMFTNTMTIFQSKLCSSHIPKLYCSNSLIDKLACSASIANTSIAHVNIAIYVVHFFFLLWSYMCLVRTCLTSQQGRKKFMQTCIPHLVSLISFAFAVLFDLMYTRFGSRMSSQGLQNFMAINVFLIPPVLNPLVYGLTLTKIHSRVLGFIQERKEIVETK